MVVRMSTILGDGANTTGAGNDTSTTQKRKTVRRPVLTLKVDRFVHYTTQVGQAILKQTQLALLLVISNAGSVLLAQFRPVEIQTMLAY